MSLNLGVILRESAKKNPDKVAIVVGETKLTYGQVHTYAQKLAGSLKKLGVSRGQHVALMLPNVPQFTIAYYAIHYVGGVVVPLNVLLKGDEVQYHLDDSDSVAIIAWEGFLEHAQAGFARADVCKHLIVAKADPTDVSAPDGMQNMTALIGGGEPVVELPDTMPDDTAVMLYTSGTTGVPKGVAIRHCNVTQLLEGIGRYLPAAGVWSQCHSYGFDMSGWEIFGALTRGGRLVVAPDSITHSPDDLSLIHI